MWTPEPFPQFVLDLSCGRILLVVGRDKFVAAKDLQNPVILALLQGEKSASKLFSFRLGRIFASHRNIIDIRFRSIENPDTLGGQLPTADQEVANGFIDGSGVN